MRSRSVAFFFAALAACGEAREPDAERAQLEARGFTAVRIVERRPDGSLLFEATKDGARCEGEARFGAGGEARIASRCEDALSIEALERACAEDPSACVQAAAAVRDAPPVDWPRATASSLRACEAGFERECLYVAMAHELGERGVAKDLAAARALYQRACAAGAASACPRARRLDAP